MGKQLNNETHLLTVSCDSIIICRRLHPSVFACVSAYCKRNMQLSQFSFITKLQYEHKSLSQPHTAPQTCNSQSNILTQLHPITFYSRPHCLYTLLLCLLFHLSICKYMTFPIYLKLFLSLPWSSTKS